MVTGSAKKRAKFHLVRKLIFDIILEYGGPDVYIKAFFENQVSGLMCFGQLEIPKNRIYGIIYVALCMTWSVR